MDQGHTLISAREYKQISVETVESCISAPKDRKVGGKTQLKNKQTNKRDTAFEGWNNSKLGIYFPGSWDCVLDFRSWILAGGIGFPACGSKSHIWLTL